MKKKVMMIGVGLTVGSALVITSAFAGIGGSQGYETYKDAVKATAGVTNATHHVQVTLTDNGTELLQVSAKMKADEATDSSSGTITIRPASQTADTLDYYGQNGLAILKSADSETYRLIEERDEEALGDRHDRAFGADEQQKMSEGAERVIDALVGNLKNNFALESDADGGSTVSFELSGAQIPAAANAIGSLIVKEAMSGEHQAPKPEDVRQLQDVENLLGLDLGQLAAAMPKLTDDVNIDRFGWTAEVDANDYIDKHELSLTISGKDAAGQAHTVVLQANVEVSDRNATKPDTIDLTGKQTEIIDLSRYE